MMVIVISSGPPRLRGQLAASLPEVRAGVFVGDNPARTRRRIRKQVETLIDGGDALMIWKAPTDRGFDFQTAGRNRRMPVDFDGLNLVSFFPRE
ncbi:type I-E CRISPR-associated endoribonuclease Cas2e [Pseudogemmobacter humi]|uniref:CRISPR-associated endoribonuclease Cas2 n=1 Tax=Pseudogemmobacter humi TaxID=2483812 RepID=A0A3P5XDG9_9RHOB|nr:type I-E CRISPR-associated endoribonuclease Cas2e [Pseudogemmobacter humi]VDC26517.1 CRISPR-associated endoribonuclease Cas2 [Pseudogemmobacter humi]